MPGTTHTASTLVNSDPGPMTTWSASDTAASTSSGAGASGGTIDTEVMGPADSDTLTWPTTSVPATSALSTTGSEVAGRTRPWAPSSPAARSRARPKSPVTLARPAMIRLPRAWPSRSPDGKRYSKASAHGDSGGGHGHQAAAQVARGGDAGDLAQPAARPSVVGHRHHRGHPAGVLLHGPEGGGQAVAAAEGHDVGAAASARRSGGRWADRRGPVGRPGPVDAGPAGVALIGRGPGGRRPGHSRATGSEPPAPRPATPSGAGRRCSPRPRSGRTFPP